MLKIRLMRIGTKKRPFYRVVAVDERNKRTGGYVENLGTYNPLTEPKEIKLNQDRIDHWVKQGAQMSVGFLRIIGKAPKRAPRKPKKPARNASQSDAGGETKSGTPSAQALPETQSPKEPVETESKVSATEAAPEIAAGQPAVTKAADEQPATPSTQPAPAEEKKAEEAPVQSPESAQQETSEQPKEEEKPTQ